jgi:protein TonB
MAYRPKPSLTGRLVAIGIALAVQVVLVLGLASGLVQSGIKAALQEIEATVLPPQEKPPDAPPPPPPPVDVPPPYIPPPDVSIEAPQSATAPRQVQSTAAVTTTVYPKPGRACGLPDYPAVEKRLGHEGKVVIYLCISIEGQLTEASIKASSGFPALDQSALAWAQRCRWTPARISGAVQSICFDQPYRFQLKDN